MTSSECLTLYRRVLATDFALQTTQMRSGRVHEQGIRMIREIEIHATTARPLPLDVLKRKIKDSQEVRQSDL